MLNLNGAPTDLAPNVSGDITVSGTITAADIHFSSLPEYADNATALAGGLVAGDLYATAAGAVLVVIPAA